MDFRPMLCLTLPGLLLALPGCRHFERAERCGKVSTTIEQGLTRGTGDALRSPDNSAAWQTAASAYRSTAAELSQLKDDTSILGSTVAEESRLLGRSADAAQNLATALDKGDSRVVGQFRAELTRAAADHQRLLERLKRACRP
jgi:hypothetical protein